jgi:hypothetical protein
LLLSDRLQDCRCQLAAARSVFAAGDWDGAAATEFSDDEEETL